MAIELFKVSKGALSAPADGPWIKMEDGTYEDKKILYKDKKMLKFTYPVSDFKADDQLVSLVNITNDQSTVSSTVDFTVDEVQKLKAMIELVDLEPVKEKMITDWCIMDVTNVQLWSAYPTTDSNAAQLLLSGWQPFGPPVIEVEPPAIHPIGQQNSTEYSMKRILQAWVKYG